MDRARRSTIFFGGVLTAFVVGIGAAWWWAGGEGTSQLGTGSDEGFEASTPGEMPKVTDPPRGSFAFPSDTLYGTPARTMDPTLETVMGPIMTSRAENTAVWMTVTPEPSALRREITYIPPPTDELMGWPPPTQALLGPMPTDTPFGAPTATPDATLTAFAPIVATSMAIPYPSVFPAAYSLDTRAKAKEYAEKVSSTSDWVTSAVRRVDHGSFLEALPEADRGLGVRDLPMWLVAFENLEPMSASQFTYRGGLATLTEGGFESDHPRGYVAYLLFDEFGNVFAGSFFDPADRDWVDLILEIPELP